jgi:hypothetical protein
MSSRACLEKISEVARFREVFACSWDISHLNTARDEQMNKVCVRLTIWTKTNVQLLDSNRGKQIDFFQPFVSSRSGVAKWQHLGIWLSVSSLDSKMKSGNIHNEKTKNM